MKIINPNKPSSNDIEEKLLVELLDKIMFLCKDFGKEKSGIIDSDILTNIILNAFMYLPFNFLRIVFSYGKMTEHEQEKTKKIFLKSIFNYIERMHSEMEN